jgi:Flp pilus assembly pilin Flp
MVQNMFVVLKAALKDRKGVSSLEHVVLAVAIVATVTVTLGQFASSLGGVFSKLIADLR